METPVIFESKGQQLVGMLHLPDRRRGRFPAAMLLHGFTGTKVEPHRLFVKLGRALARCGIACLRFDFRGAGDSAGEFEETSIRTQMADTIEALRFLGRHPRVNSRRLALVGLSLGAAVAALVAGRTARRWRSLVLLAPVAEGAGILDNLSTPDAVSALAQTGITDHGGTLVGISFIRQFAEMKPLREVSRCPCPVLIVHGEADDTVPVEHATLYERALRSPARPVKKVIIPGANHTFDSRLWEQRLLNETVAWLTATLKEDGESD